jgi:glutamate-1-semialdehyde 2,1-aminomutase
VISGFRLGRGGAQAMHGVTPDLTALGKAIGGGFPIAAFGGRADVMDYLAPVGPVYQAGTLSGNPVAVAAGLAQLGELTPAVYAQLDGIAASLTSIFTDAFSEAGVTDALVVRHGTLLGIMFGLAEAPTEFEAISGADHARYGRFFHAMLDNGVYLAPSGYEVVFPSVALDDEALRSVADAASAAAKIIA